MLPSFRCSECSYKIFFVFESFVVGFGFEFRFLRPEQCLVALYVKSWKRWPRDVINTFVALSDLVRDVTDTDCWAQKGSIHGNIFLNKQDQNRRLHSCQSKQTHLQISANRVPQHNEVPTCFDKA